MKGVIYGIIGGIFSLVLFLFLNNVVHLGSKIAIGTIILSTVICGCTGILVEKLNNK